MNVRRSKAEFIEAKKFIPGGVNSPVRAFKQVKGTPRFMRNGRGSSVTDVDSNVYTDLCCSWGALLLGHAEKSVTAAALKAARNGSTYGCPTPLETELAKLICGAMPALEKIRFVSSGTEAVMSALRLARAYTGRRGIIKFDGCYHGHSDAMLVNAGSGLFTLKKASSAGVAEEVVRETYSIPYNDPAALERLLEKKKGAIACVIIEPVAANSGVILPKPGYLKTVRELASKYGALLIFDEVITGFRLGPAGAQGYYGIRPDLTCLGKIIGGGFPAAAFGGRAEIMQLLAPEGPVYQAGTLSGNPVAMAAGAQTLRKALRPDFYKKLEEKAAHIEKVLKNLPGVRVNRIGSMFTLFFINENVTDSAAAEKCDKKRYAAWHEAMLNSQFYLPPSQFEACFVSAAHTKKEVEAFAAACADWILNARAH